MFFVTNSSRLRRSLRSLAAGGSSLACVLALSAAASAQQAPPAPPAAQPGCPPGSWFCADSTEKPAAPAGQPVAPTPAPKAPAAAPPPSDKLEPLPPAAPAPPPAPPPSTRPPPSYYPPPVVVYEPPPPVYVHEAPPPYYYSPRPADQPPHHHEWGMNFHFEGAMLGHAASADSTGMGGGGVGLRYKPMPWFGVEGDLDFVGGRDYYGFRRNETAFTLNALFFVNPRSKAQVYLLAGFGWSGANVTDDTGFRDVHYTYGYFGAQAGAGLEYRFSKHFAMNADLRGFVRGRVDDRAYYQAEFVDANGRVSNSSGGGLITLGATFYF